MGSGVLRRKYSSGSSYAGVGCDRQQPGQRQHGRLSRRAQRLQDRARRHQHCVGFMPSIRRSTISASWVKPSSTSARARCKKPATTSMSVSRAPASLRSRPRAARCIPATAAFSVGQWAVGYFLRRSGHGRQWPIPIPPGPVSISPDGTISSNGAIAGKLKLVSVSQGHRPRSHGQQLLFRARQNRN